uniref:N/A n=1 Tax=Ganoderma boninense TaxID=34458 RepID=A0A5K1JW75_9APHY|nr:N/A [Ganoderma boninense]
MTRAETELIQMTQERRENAKTRTPWRHRKKGQYKLTNIQKAQRKIANLDRKETLNQMLQDARDRVMEIAGEMQKRFPRHNDKYYFRLIMQDSRLHAKSRNPSRWNAFLSQEMERRNAGVTDGRKNVSEEARSQEIAAVWRSMTKDEQIAATEERMQLIADRRSARQRKIPTAPIQIFHDTRATTQNIENELRALNARTGRNALLVMTSPHATDYGQPYVFHTSQRIVDFLMLTMRSTLPEFAMKMEGYILSGVQGLRQSYRETIILLKREASRIINDKLREVSGGATYFRAMGEDEWREWRCKRRGLDVPSVGDNALESGPEPSDLSPSEIEPPSTSPTPVTSASSDARPSESTASTPGRTPTSSTSLTESPDPSTPDVSGAGMLATSLASAPPALSSPPLSLPVPIDAVPFATSTTSGAMHTRFVSVNVVTGSDGQPLAVVSRQRKTRSDKGKRKRKPAAEDASTSTTAAELNSRKKSKAKAA